MNQTRLESLVEVCIGTSIGFTISYSVGPLMYMYLSIPYSYTGNLVITTGFTVLSIVRSYIVRRWCQTYLRRLNKFIVRKIQNA